MNQAQALAKLRKALGAKLRFRTDKKALNAEGRAEAMAASRVASAKRQAAEAAMNARRDELLRDDAAYQTARAEYLAASAERDALIGKAHAHPITVGTLGSMFFSVKAEGDNWDEVVEKVCKTKETA